MRRFSHFTLSVLLLCSFLLSPAPAVLAASTRYVSTTGSDSGDCAVSPCLTISYAFTQSASGDTINVAAGTYTTSAELTITKDITISGAGAASTIVQAAASAGIADHRLFKDSAAIVTIQNMTIRYGVEASGGAINNASGTLTLNNLIISDNQVKDTTSNGLNGGAISGNSGSVTINNSAIINNSVTTSDALTSRGNGGGIFIGSGTLNVNNTTISGNSAKRGGGGLYANGGTLNVSYSTIANNTSDNDSDADGDGGGIKQNAGTINLKSSIVAGNKKGTSTDNDCSGTITSQGYNLTGSGTSCSLGGTGDVTVTPSTVFTSLLGSLANNGGSTYTHLLYGGNAAQDAIPNGTNSCGSGSFTQDQRGSTRPYNSNCDIGAYESQDARPSVSMSTTASNPTTTSPIPVTVIFSEGVTGFTSGDITPGNATVSNFSGSGASYSFDLIPSGDGTVTADIAAGVAQDSVYNYNTAASQFSTVYDTTAPSVTSFTATSPSTSLNIPITAFTATDAVGVSGYLITESATPPSAGAAGWTASAPTTYTVAGDGAYELYPWAEDAAGNVSAVYGSPVSVSVDTTVPTVVSSVRVNTSPTRAASVDFIVTFAEPVSGVDTSDFSLVAAGSLTGESVTSVSGSGTAYTVSVSTGSGSGTIRLDVHDDDSIIDGASNPIGGNGSANGNFVAGELYTIDKTAPTAGSLFAPNVTTGAGTTYSFTVTFSDNLAINSTSLDGSDIRVTGPGGFNQLATFVGVTPAGNGTLRTATYQITAPGGAWDSVDGGTYTIAVEANQVFDSVGNGMGATSLGSFQASLNYTTYLPLVQ